MVTSDQVRRQVEAYFGDEWVWHVLKAGTNWGIIPGVNEYMDFYIDMKEIRIYPVKSNRESAIRLAVWDYGVANNIGKNRDDMYIRTEQDLANIPILLDKFFG